MRAKKTAFGEVLHTLIRNSGQARRKLAAKLGVSDTLLYNYMYKTDEAFPNYDRLRAIARHLGLSAKQFNTLTNAALDHLRSRSATWLDDKRRGFFEGFENELMAWEVDTDEEAFSENELGPALPLLWDLPCGTEGFAPQAPEPLDWINLTTDEAGRLDADHGDFAAWARGDSMAPEIQDGDLLMFRRAPYSGRMMPELHRRIVAVEVVPLGQQDGDVTVKRLMIFGGTRLVLFPINPAAPSREFSATDDGFRPLDNPDEACNLIVHGVLTFVRREYR